MPDRHKVWIGELRRRDKRSDSSIARDIERGRLRPPHYAANGYRYWWSDELDEDDGRREALGTGPRVRPPRPAPSRRRSVGANQPDNLRNKKAALTAQATRDEKAAEHEDRWRDERAEAGS